jgi:hypothetical protein
MFWAIALAVASAAASKKSANKQKKAARIQQHAVALQNRRARLDAVKQYREARAAVLSGITNAGGAESSAAKGIQGSLTSQIAENLSFSKEQELLGTQANVQLQKANKYAFIASALSMGSSIAGSTPSGGGSSGGSTTGGAIPVPPVTINQGTNISPFIMNRSNIDTSGLA